MLSRARILIRRGTVRRRGGDIGSFPHNDEAIAKQRLWGEMPLKPGEVRRSTRHSWFAPYAAGWLVAVVMAVGGHWYRPETNLAVWALEEALHTPDPDDEADEY